MPVTPRRTVHFATRHTDNSACGEDMKGDRWTPVVREVTCPRCRQLLPERAMGIRVDRLAIALWDINRDETNREPSFHTYADEKGDEPMPFYEQDDEFKKFWRRRARRLLDLIDAPDNGRTKLIQQGRNDG